MTTITSPAEFAAALEAKFAPAYAPGGRFEILPTPVYSIGQGTKYVRIAVWNGTQRLVFCFVEKATGRVFKAAGYSGPAKGARYASMDDALAAADQNGAFLYVKALAA